MSVYILSFFIVIKVKKKFILIQTQLVDLDS